MKSRRLPIAKQKTKPLKLKEEFSIHYSFFDSCSYWCYAPYIEQFEKSLLLNEKQSMSRMKIRKGLQPKEQAVDRITSDSCSQIRIEDIFPDGAGNIRASTPSPKTRRKAAILRRQKIIRQNAPFF